MKWALLSTLLLLLSPLTFAAAEPSGPELAINEKTGECGVYYDILHVQQFLPRGWESYSGQVLEYRFDENLTSMVRYVTPIGICEINGTKWKTEGSIKECCQILELKVVEEQVGKSSVQRLKTLFVVFMGLIALVALAVIGFLIYLIIKLVKHLIKRKI
ncbi:MAG: hypothetical protein ABIH34_00595 [Nanoarchaeota archaeon]